MKRIFSLLFVAVLSIATTFAQTLVTPPDDADVDIWYITGGTLMLQTSSTEFTDYTNNISSLILAAFHGSDFYIQGLAAPYSPTAWVKGRVEGTRIVIPSGQCVNVENEEYINGQDVNAVSQYDPAIDIIFHYDAEKGTLRLDPGVGILQSSAPNVINQTYGYWEGLVLTKYQEPTPPEVVTLPEGVSAEEYTFSGYEDGNEQTDKRVAQVAIVDADVYVQGLSNYLPEAWVKGTLEGSKVTFPANQPLGNYGQFTIMFNPDADVVFDYDAATKALTCKSYVSKAGQYVADQYSNVSLTLGTTGITAMAGEEGTRVRTYTLQGTQARQGARGLFIQQCRMADGSLRTTKFLRR